MRRTPSPTTAAVDAFRDPAGEALAATATEGPTGPIQIAAAIGVGVLALVDLGLMGILLPALVEEGRLSTSGIGLAAMVEALISGLVTGGAGILLRPVRLRMIAAIAGVFLIGLNLATLQASGLGVMLVRGLAGLPEGVLLWITIAFVSRSATPERWAATLFTAMGACLLAVATVLTAVVIPRFGATGGYVLLALGAAFVFPLAPLLPRSLAPAVATEGEPSGAPPLRGWIALAATLCMAASLAAVGVYVVPLAQEAGLSAGVGRSAVSVAIACQMIGGVFAALLAGRARYLPVFWICGLVFLGTWAIYAMHAPAWLFIGAAGLSGAASYVAAPFLVPMTIEADPSRRAAMQSGAIQLLSGALGPMLAAFAVHGRHVQAVLVLAAALQAAGLGATTLLHRIARTEQARLG